MTEIIHLTTIKRQNLNSCLKMIDSEYTMNQSNNYRLVKAKSEISHFSSSSGIIASHINTQRIKKHVRFEDIKPPSYLSSYLNIEKSIKSPDSQDMLSLLEEINDKMNFMLKNQRELFSIIIDDNHLLDTNFSYEYMDTHIHNAELLIKNKCLYNH